MINEEKLTIGSSIEGTKGVDRKINFDEMLKLAVATYPIENIKIFVMKNRNKK